MNQVIRDTMVDSAAMSRTSDQGEAYLIDKSDSCEQLKCRLEQAENLLKLKEEGDITQEAYAEMFKKYQFNKRYMERQRKITVYHFSQAALLSERGWRPDMEPKLMLTLAKREAEVERELLAKKEPATYDRFSELQLWQNAIKDMEENIKSYPEQVITADESDPDTADKILSQTESRNTL